VLLREGDRWRVMSISGQEVVEKKSAMVKAMSAFVGAHAVPELVLLSKKELLARAEAAQQDNGNGDHTELVPAVRRTDEIDLAYFQLSHVISAAVAPMVDRDKQLIGAYFAESTARASSRAAGSKDLTATTRLASGLPRIPARPPPRRIITAAVHIGHEAAPGTRRLLTGQHRRRTSSSQHS
jgi:hypothetical protein